jgi:F-box/leucine-rich repeat protein 10/11
LSKWAEYVAQRFGKPIPSDAGPSSKVYNVISLEITGTDLGNKVRPPTIVSEIDWVDNCWDFGPGGKQAALREEAEKVRKAQGAADGGNGKEGPETQANGEGGKRAKARDWPKVQLYCLVSTLSPRSN